MPSLDNWIETPQEIIQKIYGRNFGFITLWNLQTKMFWSTEKHGGSSPWEKEVDDYFTSRLATPEVWISIPSLNEVPIKDLRHGQLVRFRGMFQDQLGPEMYGSGAIVKNTSSGTQKNVTGKFKDELSLGVTNLCYDSERVSVISWLIWSLS